MNVRMEVEIAVVERQGADSLFVEGRTSDGGQAAFLLRVSSLGGELLLIGQTLSITLSTPPSAVAGSSLRDRMQRPVASGSNNNAGARPNNPPLSTARAPTGASQDASGLLLSSILGNTPSTGAAVSDRDVQDEMNALLGPPRRKG